ncbi:MAG TPA: hypothetical protein VM165_04415, partial [Planctomycetaceae bacterium]|nr:hypothetical protein [Planctomycetaceae bacterium]
LFLGTFMLVQSGISVAAVISLLLAGAGPVALAAGITIPLMLGSVVSTWRLSKHGSDLVWNLPQPSWAGMARLARDAGGSWMSGVGGRLTMSSNALLVSAARGTPDDVIRFVCTSKLGDMLMMQSWQVIDSGLVGYAQLHGEGRRERVRQIAVVMTRLALIGTGAVAIVILGFNPALVAIWLGSDKFGGVGLNAATTGTLLGLTLVHVASTTAATVGYRVSVGAVNLVHGLCYAALAVGLGLWLGPLLGVAIAGGLSALVIGLPLLTKLQAAAIQLSWIDLVRIVWREWLPRAVLPMAGAAWLGLSQYGMRWEICAPATAALGLCYAWLMRPMLSEVPLPPRLRMWTRYLGLIPHTAAQVPVQS